MTSLNTCLKSKPQAQAGGANGAVTPQGVSMQEIVAATGWQAHSARGAMSGALGKKLGLVVTSAKEDGRGRVYRISSDTA